MKKYKRKISYISIVFLMLLIFSTVSFAHSGRTDSSGGHHDYNNRSGLGSYHYHHGMGPHLHPNGVCPYSSSSNNSSSNSGSSNYNSNSQDYITIKDYPKSIIVGKELTLNFTIYSYYDDFSYTISSSDSSVIKINNNNTLRAVGEGSADITIKTSHTSKTITIQVKEIFADGFKIYSKLEKLQLGERLAIVYRVEPNSTTNKEVKFSSSDTNIAVIEGEVIVPVGVGNVTITGETENGLIDSFDISIYEVFPEEIITNTDSIELELTDTYKLEYEIEPSNANNKECVIICENNDIVSIDSNGLITPIKDGNTNIIIQSNANNISKVIPLKVFYIPCEKIDIIDSTNYWFSNFVDKSDEIRLNSKIIPENSTYRDVAWSSSNSNIISIENDRYIINGTGSVTLTCTTDDGIVANVTINVINKNDIIAILIFFIISGGTIIFCMVNSKKKKDHYFVNR